MLEAARASHEELERIERLIVKELQSEPSTARDRLYQSHRVRYMIDQITDTTNKLTDIYQHMNDDQLNGTKDEQILAQLEEQIRDYQKTHPVAMAVDVNEELEQMILKEEPRIEFSGEEGGQDHGSVPPPQLDEEDAKEIALMEAKLQKLCELLEETISRTKENVERKQALTYREMKAEREAEEETQAEAGSDDEEEEELEQRYNPLKLPMGWDGENIPYWLYKLHGLNQEFSCEICGNHRYRGRRAFEQHFRQSRHQHGMRCLGIPNTKNFNEITSIVEARQLWQELQQRERLNEWHPDLQEEYEDQEGNIYNKRTYTDLQRQGLL
ncbi:OLC1v1029876C1 [Oldenlandia corymbosa var. corymbosa]|uniref:OLC1v1029876C1 n=1 Tax=Oldenlandia corymbosa var. corymbosa TaxID=529605 RepID=A0AAV1CHS1_OLDCO|nr:OLC1v1029876C1 [Oldenlandia corymbosa var. corymbosa]